VPPISPVVTSTPPYGVGTVRRSDASVGKREYKPDPPITATGADAGLTASSLATRPGLRWGLDRLSWVRKPEPGATLRGAGNEQYDTRPESIYSLTKHLEEELARKVVRWDADLSITALRFSNVMTPDGHPGFAAFQSDPASRKWNRVAWGDIWSRPDLDRRSRSIVTISVPMTAGYWEEVPMHFRATITNSLTRE
jgi:hypothetical protein